MQTQDQLIKLNIHNIIARAGQQITEILRYIFKIEHKTNRAIGTLISATIF